MSQPAAAFCIHTPTWETTVASQSTVKAVLRKGLQAELGTPAAVLPEVPVPRCCRIGCLPSVCELNAQISAVMSACSYNHIADVEIDGLEGERKQLGD